MNSPERNRFTPEINEHELKDVERAGEQRREQLERFRESHETQKDTHETEVARHEALEAAEKKAEIINETNQEKSPAERRGNGSKKQQDKAFNATMAEVREQMSAPSRTFSKVIHNKAVEKASEVAGSTVARPNAILSGAIFAFILTLAVYLIAKNLGYPLSGFETIGAFLLGWIVGIIYDFLRVMITGRSNS